MARSDEVLAIFDEIQSCFSNIKTLSEPVSAAIELVGDALRVGNRVYFCGNGGSAGDAQHLAAEFLGRFQMDRAPVPAMALTTNASTMTAIANDYGYEQVFSRQLRGLTRAGDVVVGITTSGKSKNVIEAFKVAADFGAKTLALTGAQESPLSEIADLAIRVPSTKTARIQEMHIAVGHVICDRVEHELFGQS
ncbi:MAG: SIS domain-containing protein [Pseudomonadota bacterium]